MEVNSCFYSSFVFIINVLVAFYFKHYLYAALFFALLITSLLHHCQYTLLTNVLDKIAIVSIIFYGGWIFYKKLLDKNTLSKKELVLSFIVFLTFFSTMILYCYGYLNNCLCFCKDPTMADRFHSLMHFVGSLGHCCIMVF